VTRLADRPDPVPDEIWTEAAKQFDQPVHLLPAKR
jgi:hypothetical protein